MSAVLDARLWLNAHRFGARVLRAGEEPWAVPEQLGLFSKELARWLSLELVEVNVGAALVAWRQGGGGELRTPDELIDVLDGADFQDHLSEGLAAVLGAGLDCPVTLNLPGAGRLAARLGEDYAADEDACDDIAQALTGLLRGVYARGIGAVLIDESEPLAVPLYTPVVNVAANYQLPLLLTLDGILDEVPRGFSKVYSRGGSEGRYLEAGVWAAPSALDAASAYAEIPVDLTADAVLSALAALRGG